MIDVKQIIKPKKDSGRTASASVYGGRTVDEAAHAAKADKAVRSEKSDFADKAEYADRAGYASRAAYADMAEGMDPDAAKEMVASEGGRLFLSKTHDDVAEGAITHMKKVTAREGVQLGGEDSTLGVDGEGNAELLTAVVRAMIGSARFVSGAEGWRLWIDGAGLANLEVDTLTVRQVMHVVELLIDRIRSVGGKIVVSAANGKVKAVEDTGDDYRLTFETECSFKAHDLMRCQVFTGDDVREWWVEVKHADADGATVAKGEFAQWKTEPRVGDEVVLMGNTTDGKRQNLISISATEDGEPRIDVMDGVSRKSLEGALRARLGNLDGIGDDRFPKDGQPRGNGLYADNAFLRGTFLLTTGEDVRTRFEATEGKIESAVAAVRQDLMEERGFLSNPTFGDGMSHWTGKLEAPLYFLGNRWLWANGGPLVRKGDGASLAQDGGRTVVRLRNGSMTQRRECMRGVPEIKVGDDGKKRAAAVYLSFYYKVTRKGRLTIGFEGGSDEGFEEYEPLSVDRELDTTDGYEQMTVEGLWNAGGDFKIGFTGEMLVHMFVLGTDRITSLQHTYRTLFEQSEKLVRIAAENFDEKGKVADGSEIVTTAKYNALMSEKFDEQGNLKNTAGLVTTTSWADWLANTYKGDLDTIRQDYVSTAAFAGLYAAEVAKDGTIMKVAGMAAYVKKNDDGTLESELKLTADKIRMEGFFTANGNFKILEDGSMEAVNGKFNGEINADKGSVGGFTIAAGRIGSEATQDSGGGSLAIYDNFFRVGGSNSFAMLGDNVIPAEAGGAFTASGRIVNQCANKSGYYDVRNANYGLFLNVSGSDRNYGLWSNAALMAPSFVSTRACLMTFDVDAGNYEMDFAQANVILMYFKKDGSSGLEVTLPDENSVARQFGVKELPEDFATVVTFRVRAGSQHITLKGIYDHGEHLKDYEMSAGNSLLVLVSKADGFRYQMLSYSY